jgi:hypothetical protein
MAEAMIGGKAVEIVEPNDWTTRELYEAEKALGLTFDGASAGAAMAITMFISLHRIEPDKPPVLLADEVMGMKFGQLTEDAAPLAESNGSAPADLPSIGPRRSEPSG